MRIEQMRVFKGRNVHSHTPVIELLLDLGGDHYTRTGDVPGFVERLLELVPTLHEHHCSRGYEGGFVERLRAGTYLGHVVEHLALELQVLAGSKVIYGHTREVDENRYRVVFEYQVREAGREAAYLALDLVADLLDSCERREQEAQAGYLGLAKQAELERAVNKLKRITSRSGFGPSTQSIIDAARARNIPVLPMGKGSYVQLGYGAKRQRICATITGQTRCLGVDLAADKAMTKHLLSEAGIPVPRGQVARDEEDALDIAHSTGLPVVIKPDDGNQGKGVSLNLSSRAEIKEAYKLARNYSSRVLVEQYIPGRHYRVLVVDGRVVAISERSPARVVGDGQHTISELIEMINRDPRRGEGHEKPLTKIKVDGVVLMVLARQNLTLNYVPGEGEEITLRDNANLSTGGTAADATEKCSEHNRRIFQRTARLLDLDVAGVDVVAQDLQMPLEQGGAIIEVNAAPGIRMHHFPYAGQPRDAAGAIVDSLFADQDEPLGRIPITAVTGTNGKTTTTRLINHLLEQHGVTTGMTTTDGIYIGGEQVLSGDNTGPLSAENVLTDPLVEAAVLETARGGLIRGGLAFDLCDVAVVTNIRKDHLGLDGVETLEDLCHVKSLIVEAVKNDGYAVLNAADPRVRAMAGQCPGQVIFFARQLNQHMLKHLRDGGRAVFVEEGRVVLGQGSQRQQLLAVKDIPLTLGGKALYNLENALAATGAAWGLGLPLDGVASGLKVFRPGLATTPGRLNLFGLGELTVVVDYGHNADGCQSLLETVQSLGFNELTGVVGVPGDRQDEAIQAFGEVAGEFLDRAIIKEDYDLRGRKAGEAAQLLRRGLQASGGGPEIQVELNEQQAVRRAVGDSLKTCDKKAEKERPAVVVFYEKLEPVMEAIEEVAGTHGLQPEPLDFEYFNTTD